MIYFNNPAIDRNLWKGFDAWPTGAGLSARSVIQPRRQIKHLQEKINISQACRGAGPQDQKSYKDISLLSQGQQCDNI
jgi:hypothetical protein